LMVTVSPFQTRTNFKVATKVAKTAGGPCEDHRVIVIPDVWTGK
jgi:hypothetical protein